jgi:basic membrane lipoprotein Med (substrate-binding protein (PBP1-ABC) superfamily)
MKKIAMLLSLTIILTLVLSACGSAAAPATQAPAKKFKVAVVMPSAKNDLAFSQSMYDALTRVQKDMGGPDKFEFVFSENMFVVDDAAAAIRDYATKGYDLVIAHGSQYGSSLQEIAPDFPKTSFAWGTTADTFGQPNIFAYQASSEEGGYVNGALAATLSKSGIIGVVGPIETGDAKLYIDGFKAGALATKPDAQVNVNYIGSFSDTALAAEAANTHLSAGADVLTGTAQMVVGAIGKAKEANALWFGTQSNQTSLAPSIVVASQVYHWEGILKEMIDSIQKGTLGGKTFTANLANGGEVIEFNPDYKLPADAQSLADKTIAGIKDGSIKIQLPASK